MSTVAMFYGINLLNNLSPTQLKWVPRFLVMALVLGSAGCNKDRTAPANNQAIPAVVPRRTPIAAKRVDVLSECPWRKISIGNGRYTISVPGDCDLSAADAGEHHEDEFRCQTNLGMIEIAEIPFNSDNTDDSILSILRPCFDTVRSQERLSSSKHRGIQVWGEAVGGAHILTMRGYVLKNRLLIVAHAYDLSHDRLRIEAFERQLFGSLEFFDEEATPLSLQEPVSELEVATR